VEDELSVKSRDEVTRRAFLRTAGAAAASLWLTGCGNRARVGSPASPAAPPQAPTAATTSAGPTEVAGAVSPTPIAPAAVPPGIPPLALIANSMSNTLTVVDPATLEPAGEIRVGREPHKFRRALNGRSVYSCNVTSNELIEIDLATKTIVARRPILDPYNVSFTPDRSRLYKVAYRYDFMEIHDAATLRPLKRIRTGRNPSHVWFSPDGKWFVNTNQRAHTVSVIDTATMALAHTLPVDPLPAGIVIPPDGRHMFVACTGGNIAIFDTSDWKLVRRVRSGRGAHEIALAGDGRTIYVTNRYENTVSRVDTREHRVVSKFPCPGGPDMPFLTADGSQLWVSGRFGNTATVIDTGTERILTTFPTGLSPHGVFVGAPTT
jgi:YVTN family beta-propeller protein